jgi:hypothetical protein
MRMTMPINGFRRKKLKLGIQIILNLRNVENQNHKEIVLFHNKQVERMQTNQKMEKIMIK